MLANLQVQLWKKMFKGFSLIEVLLSLLLLTSMSIGFLQYQQQVYQEHLKILGYQQSIVTIINQQEQVLAKLYHHG